MLQSLIMLDPKASLAIHAPPVAPYDDGCSTDSEDIIERELLLHGLSSSSSAISVPKATEEEHCKTCRGYLLPSSERIRLMKTAAPPSRECCCCHITYPHVALTEESKNPECRQPRCYMCNWAVKVGGYPGRNGVKRTVDGAVKAPSGSDENCRRCRRKLVPLAERVKRLKQVTIDHRGPGLPVSRQCSCCRITYPLIGLAVNSREPTCRLPVCLSCESVATPAPMQTGIERQNGVTTNGTDKTVEEEKENNESCCRNCKGNLPPLEDRLKAMKPTAEQGSRVYPSTRQCSCCFITLPLTSLTEESRSVKCTKPYCFGCDDARRDPSASEEKAPASTVTEETKKVPEIVVIDEAEDEEGELVETDVCKCCGGKLIALARRVELMKEAAKQYGGKGPPPSRQCACCRVTYPSAALTKKSRKLTRAVPICHNCCQSGGSPIYEMLCTSDEFIEAFKVENPDMARQLLKKKESGVIEEAAKNQRKRQEKKTVAKPRPVMGAAPRPVYHRQVLAARKCIGSPRMIVGSSSNDDHTTPQESVSMGGDETERRNRSRNFPPPGLAMSRGQPRHHLYPKMARKSVSIFRLIIGKPGNGNG